MLTAKSFTVFVLFLLRVFAIEVNDGEWKPQRRDIWDGHTILIANSFKLCTTFREKTFQSDGNY
jgi:hypothetical protein